MAHSSRSPQHDAHHSARTREQLSKSEQQFQHHHGTPAPGTDKPGSAVPTSKAPGSDSRDTPGPDSRVVNPDDDCGGM